MKRIVIALIATLSLALVASLAFAQEPHRMMKRMGPGGEDVVAALGLSADQKAQWDSIHQQLEASMKPLFDQHQAAEEQLHALVESSNPDPTAVGKQFLAMRAIDKQIQAAHESTKSKIEAILTPDQKVKFEAFHAGMEHGEHGPMMMHMRHPEGSRE